MNLHQIEPRITQWRIATGELIQISTMTDTHIRNAIFRFRASRYISPERQGMIDAVRAEAARRGLAL